MEALFILIATFVLGGIFTAGSAQYQIGSFVISHIAALGITFAVYSLLAGIGLIKLIEVIGSLFKKTGRSK